MAANNVVKLSDYAYRFRYPKNSRHRLPRDPVLACGVCESESFHIFTNGKVHCNNCHALVSNVRAELKDVGEDKQAS